MGVEAAGRRHDVSGCPGERLGLQSRLRAAVDRRAPPVETHRQHHLRLEPSRWPILPGALRSLFQYHGSALHFHNGLSSPHPYQSVPWSWLVLGRPVSYYYPGGKQAPQGCGAATCVREILAIGTPALWWAFIPALLWMVWLLISRRDWRAGAVLAAFAAGWLSWMINLKRTMFLFYMVPVVPFLVIDMVVSSVLLSMGMMQLPPVMVSLPFKILLFIMVDGWNLVISSLVKSYV